MPYLGKSPQHGNYSKLDDFSGDFDGSDATHAIASNGTAITPVRPEALIISINGVIQEPVTDYTVSGTNITFTTAPTAGDNFFGVAMGEQLQIGTPSDGTITSAKLSSAVLTGHTDIGGAIADADLFLVDDGAGGTLRKTAASRIKTYAGTDLTAIADGSAGSPSIANSGDTNTGVFFPAADTVGVTTGGTERFRFGSTPIPGGMKNLLLNGSCMVSQRGTSFTGLGTGTSDEYTLDRWSLATIDTSTARWTITQESSGGITGKDKWLKCVNTTADASPSGGEGQLIQQKMEGFVAKPLLGPSDGYIDGFTVSVDMILYKDGASSISFPATVSCVAYTIDTGRGCIIDATITSAATWQRVNFVFPADTSGTFNIDNTVGFRVGFGLYAGTSRDAADGSWFSAATNAAVSEDAENIADATGNYLGFTNAQLEVGPVATDYAHEDIGTTLSKCQRYLFRWTPSTANEIFGSGQADNTTQLIWSFNTPVTMRAAPTFTATAAATFDVQGKGTAINCSAVGADRLNVNGCRAVHSVSSGLTAGECWNVGRDGSDTTYMELSSEL
jgi:hypothetical protein